MFCPKPPGEKKQNWLEEETEVKAGQDQEGSVPRRVEAGGKCRDNAYSEENHTPTPKPDFSPTTWEEDPLFSSSSPVQTGSTAELSG